MIRAINISDELIMQAGIRGEVSPALYSGYSDR